MPANFTHYRFGRMVLSALPELSFLRSGHARQAFLTGLHGPDLLFFHRPLFRGAVCRQGYAMHEEPARAFFEHGVRFVQKTKNPVAEAYLMGFACHFALDSACHGYIGKYEKRGVSHAKIEAELDRAFLLEAGENPKTCSSAAHILPSNALAAVIAPFFGISEADTFEALRSIRFYSGVLTAKNPVKRAVLSAAAIVPAVKKYVGDMVIAKKPDVRCAESTAWLVNRTKKSVETACTLVLAVREAIHSGAALPAAFDANYE